MCRQESTVGKSKKNVFLLLTPWSPVDNCTRRVVLSLNFSYLPDSDIADPSFNYLVGAGEQCGRHHHTQRLGGF